MSVEKIKQRKKDLQDEVDRIETTYTKRVSKIEGGIRKTLQPIKNVKKRPFVSLSVSIAAGFLLGISGKRKSLNKAAKSSNPSEHQKRDRYGFTSMLISELKRVAARRAMIYITGMVDQKVLARFMNQSDQEDNRKTGEKE